MTVLIVVLSVLILIALVFGGDAGAGLLGLACGCVVILAILAALAFIGFVVFA